MTVAAQAGYQTFNGSGSTGPFTFNFRFFDNSQIVITKTTAVGTVLLTQITDYTLSGAGSTSGGTVTLTTALNNGESIFVKRVLPLAQPVAYGNFGAFFSETHESSYDLLTMMIQQLDDILALYISTGLVVTAADGSDRRFSITVASGGIDDNGVEILYPVIRAI